MERMSRSRGGWTDGNDMDPAPVIPKKERKDDDVGD